MEIKCLCNHCGERIAFDSTQVGLTVPCPHCSLETVLYSPPVPISQAPQPVAVTSAMPRDPISQQAQVTIEIKRGVSPLGIAALIIGIIACVICWIPIFGLFAIPLAVIGIILAFIGLLMAAMNKKSGFSYPVSGGIVCLLAICIAIFSTGAFATIFSHALDEAKKTNQTGTAATTDDNNVVWEKSDTVTQGDFKIKITQSSVTAVAVRELSGNNMLTQQNYLVIRLTVLNNSSTKKTDFQTWRGDVIGSNCGTLVDDNGNVYKRITFSMTEPLMANEDSVSIYPKQSASDELVSELPVANLKWLHLELPAENFGGTGSIRFEIPASNIKG